MSIEQAVAFAIEIDRLKRVDRAVNPIGAARRENPAEHSWHAALLALVLAPYASVPVDLTHVICLLLVHDIGEIDVGDVMAFHPAAADRAIAEQAAAARIFGLLPESSGLPLLALWEEFEAAETPEARYAHALDRAMPVILNLANGGQSWLENGISYERVVDRVRDPIDRGCPALWHYLAARLEAAKGAGLFGEDGKARAVPAVIEPQAR